MLSEQKEIDQELQLDLEGRSFDCQREGYEHHRLCADLTCICPCHEDEGGD